MFDGSVIMDVLYCSWQSLMSWFLLDSRWSGLYTWKENKATAARGREERTSVNSQQQADDNCRVCCGMWGFLETLLHVQTSYLCYKVSLKNGGSVAHASLQSQSHFSRSWLHWFFFFFLLRKWKSHHSGMKVREIYQLCSLLLTFDWELGCLVKKLLVL